VRVARDLSRIIMDHGSYCSVQRTPDDSGEDVSWIILDPTAVHRGPQITQVKMCGENMSMETL
jgi:hypothetical protein